MERRIKKKRYDFIIKIEDEIIKYKSITYGEFKRRLDFKVEEQKNIQLNYGWNIDEILVGECYDMRNNLINITFKMSRLETEEEVKKREEKNRKAKLTRQRKKDKSKERRREMFEKLKREFGE